MKPEKFSSRSDAGSKLGIYVIRAGSRQEAEQIAASDPYTARLYRST
jgi:uncharacterized protein YciI